MWVSIWRRCCSCYYYSFITIVCSSVFFSCVDVDVETSIGERSLHEYVMCNRKMRRSKMKSFDRTSFLIQKNSNTFNAFYDVWRWYMNVKLIVVIGRTQKYHRINSDLRFIFLQSITEHIISHPKQKSNVHSSSAPHNKLFANIEMKNDEHKMMEKQLHILLHIKLISHHFYHISTRDLQIQHSISINSKYTYAHIGAYAYNIRQHSNDLPCKYLRKI